MRRREREDATANQNFMETQSNITDIYSELSYDELKSVLEGWLNPTAEEAEESVSQQTLSTPSAPKTEAKAAPAAAPFIFVMELYYGIGSRIILS